MTQDQLFADTDAVDAPASDDPLRRYHAEHAQARPIRWYDTAESARADLALPDWVDLPWAGFPDDASYVVLRHGTVRREVCPKGRSDGDRHDYCRHRQQTHDGWLPMSAHRTQLDAVQWVLADAR